MKKKYENVWISSVHLKPLSGNIIIPNAKGAVVNVLFVADSDNDYKQTVLEALEHMHFQLISFDEVNLFNSIADDNLNDKELLSLAKKAVKTGYVLFSTYYTYDEE